MNPAPGGKQLRLVVEAEDYEAALALDRDVLGLHEQESYEGGGDGDGGARLIAAPRETPRRWLNARLDAPAGLQVCTSAGLSRSSMSRLRATTPQIPNHRSRVTLDPAHLLERAVTCASHECCVLITLMDLITVRDIRVATTRDDLVFAPGELPLGGGTWLFSEEQPDVTGLVDLTALGWVPITETETHLVVAATCTIAELDRIPARAEWPSHPLFSLTANSLLASFKIWNVATVGGNICTSLPAGPMISLAAATDATAVVWGAGGLERRLPLAELVTGVQRNGLEHGEVLRAIEIPLTSLAARSGFRRISLSPLGRTGTMVIARLDASGEAVFTVSGGTTRPRVLRFDGLPGATNLRTAVDAIDDWYTDPHGAADWRRAMSILFAEQLREELAA